MVRQQRDIVSNLLRQSILDLCRANVCQDRGLEIDGILCVTFGDDSDDQIVVKVHEKITSAVDSIRADVLSNCTDLTGETVPVVRHGLSQQKTGDENRTAIKRAAWDSDDVEVSAKKIPRKKERESGNEATFNYGQQGSAALCFSANSVMPERMSNTDTADSTKQNGGDGFVLTEVISNGEAIIRCDSDNKGSCAEQTNNWSHTDTSNQDTVARHDIVDISGDDQESSIEIKREVISDDDGDFSVCLNDEFALSDSSPGSGQFNSTSDQYLQEMACEFCQLLVADFATLTEHCSSVHQAYTCPSCYRSFLQFTDYETHLQVHCKDRVTHSPSKAGRQSICPTGHKCGVCGLVPETSTDMLGHLSAAHEFDSIFTCSLCSQYFPNMPTFVIHRKLTHSNVQECRCKTCDICFTAAEFAHHKQECSNNVLVTFSGAAHSNVNGYGGNQSVSHASEQSSQSDTGDVVKLEPKFSEQNFTDDSARNGEDRHLQNVGLQDGVAYSCDGFTTHSTNTDDGVLYGNPLEMSTGTPRGGFRSRIQKNLSARQSQGQFSCQNCFEMFAQFNEYEVHCRLRHGRFVCPYCMTSFANRRNQQRHTRKHTGEQPYVCPQCLLRFYRDDDLRRHKLKHVSIETDHVTCEPEDKTQFEMKP